MNLDTQHIIARNLKTLRQSNCMSQAELSEILGISRSTYAAYEMGSRTPDAEVMYKVAHYFGIKIDDLFIEDHYKFLSAIASGHYNKNQEKELLLRFNKLMEIYQDMFMIQAHNFAKLDKQNMLL